MNRVVIVEVSRTAIGKQGGIHRNLDERILITPLLQKHVSKLAQVDEVILGNIVGHGGNVARFSALNAGLNCPGLTIDSQCIAGLTALKVGMSYIQSGLADSLLIGGTESLSTSPYPTRAQFSPEEIGDPDMIETAMLQQKRSAMKPDLITAKTRMSYERALASPVHKKTIYNNETDEFLERADLKVLERVLAKQTNSVNPATSSRFSDGAALLTVVSENFALEHDLQPVLEVVATATTTVSPYDVPVAAITATQRLLEENNLQAKDIDRFDIVEAYATKIVAFQEALGVSDSQLNPDGGALAYGHPYAASGIISVAHTFNTFIAEKNIEQAVVAAAGAGGIGQAFLLKRYH